MSKPPVWQMIREAIETLNSRVKYSDIKRYINDKWEGVNQDTITAQIIVLTVNHNSRIYYPENLKPRITDKNFKYDILFSVGRGEVERYNPAKHGIWEILQNIDNKLEVRILEEPKEILKIFTPSDIVWIKNVTNTETGEAYLHLDKNTFVLNFPTKHRNNVSSPQIGDIILIRQKLNGIPAFTHLVSPIDEEVFDENIRPDYRYGRRVKVVAQTYGANIPVANTLWGKINLAGVSQGNACKIGNMKNIGNLEELQLDVWQRFKSYFIEREKSSVISVDSAMSEINNSYPELTVEEGKLKLVSHMARERDSRIIKEKKRVALANNILHCEVCEFSFSKIYGANFIECHHRTPISESGVTLTSLDDLALVCPNCHRMLHTRFEEKYLTIRELQERIKLYKTIQKND